MCARPGLTRERILDTAIALGDAEGIGAISMRRIGRELGVEAMSLYNHVANKNDILRGIAGRLLEQMMALPDEPDPDPLEAMRQVLRRYRALGQSHPRLFPILIEQSLTTPESLAALDRAMAIWKRMGFADDEVLDYFMASASLVEGYVLNELRDMTDDGRSFPDPSTLGDLFPTVAEVLSATGWDHDRGFERAVDLFLDGIRRRIEERA